MSSVQSVAVQGLRTGSEQLSLDLLTFGEAAGKVSAAIRAQYGTIPWQDISGMRNRLTHAYFDIDLDVVWTTVTKDLPPLKTNLEGIL